MLTPTFPPIADSAPVTTNLGGTGSSVRTDRLGFILSRSAAATGHRVLGRHSMAE